MERKDLEGFGLDKEAIDKVMALYGKDVTDLKASNQAMEKKFNDANTELTTVKGTVGGYEKQLKELQAKAGDNDELKSQIAKIQDQAKQAEKAGKETLAKSQKSWAIKLAATAAGARDAAIVAGLIDPEKVTVDGDKVVGVKEQIEALKGDHDYLFGSDKPAASATGRPAGNPAVNQAGAGAAKVDLATASYEEVAKAMQSKD